MPPHGDNGFGLGLVPFMILRGLDANLFAKQGILFDDGLGFLSLGSVWESQLTKIMASGKAVITHVYFLSVKVPHKLHCLSLSGELVSYAYTTTYTVCPVRASNASISTRVAILAQ
jgi:hypothetical protein